MGEFLAAGLELVYPPISNREGDWLYELPEVREHVRRSKFYMIGRRPRLYFTEPSFNRSKLRLDFYLWQKSTRRRIPFQIYLKQFLPETSWKSIDFLSGDRIIKVVETGREKEEPLVWFTPDKLLFDHWRGYLKNTGLGSARHFTTFDLLYVGISKEGNSLSRLFQQGHLKRTKILSQEDQTEAGVSISEEIMIFLFDVIPRRVRTLDITEVGLSVEPMLMPDEKKLAADAEKAFTNVLESKYNEVRYAQYPRGDDGLFHEGFDRYLYWIAEDITFRTEKATFIGNRDEAKPSSMIVIQGEEVSLVTP